MATKKTETVSETAKVVITTIKESKKEVKVSSGNDMIRIVFCGPHSHTFTDVKNGTGGAVKRLTIKGYNDDLRGTNQALYGDGHATVMSITRADWEDIKRKHGREAMFTCVPPLLFELPEKATLKDFKDEIKSTSAGLAPMDVDDPKNGIIKAAKGE